MQIKLEKPSNNGQEIGETLINLYYKNLFNDSKLKDISSQPLIKFTDYQELEEKPLPSLIREACVTGFNLINESKELIELFKDDKLRKIDRARDKINNKYGRYTITPAYRSHPWWDRLQGVIGYVYLS